MAIHDAAYASPPPSWEAFKWRLQHLAEERIGVLQRQHQAAENKAFDAMNNAG